MYCFVLFFSESLCEPTFFVDINSTEDLKKWVFSIFFKKHDYRVLRLQI